MAFAFFSVVTLPACHGENSGTAREATAEADAAATAALFAGIPQRGISLGSPDAPVTLVEFVDLDCRHCRTFALDTLPVLVQDYVREGKLRIELRNLAFVSPTSETAARLGAAITLQDRLYHFVDLFFRSHATGEPIEKRAQLAIAARIRGLDVARAVRQEEDPAARALLTDAAAEAERHDIQGTPSFLLFRTGEAPEQLDVASLAPEAFTRPIDALLARR